MLRSQKAPALLSSLTVVNSDILDTTANVEKGVLLYSDETEQL